MAKGDVTLKFDAQTGDYIQQILKVVQAHEAAALSARKMGEATAKSGDDVAAGIGKVAKAGEGLSGIGAEMGRSVVESLGLITTAAGAAGAAVELVISGVEHKIKEVETRGQIFLDKTKSINEALANSGQVGASGMVQTQINQLAGEQFAGQSFGPVDITKMFSGISGVEGAKASPQIKLDALRAALNARATGMSEDDAILAGINYADIARERSPRESVIADVDRLVAGAPGDQDGTDDALFATINLHGGMDAKALRFYTRARDKQKALRLLAAGAMGDETVKSALGDLQQIDKEDTDPAKQHALDKKLLLAAPDDQVAAGLGDEEKEKARQRVEAHLEALSQENPAAAARDRAEMRRNRGTETLSIEEGIQIRLDEIPKGHRADAILNDPTLAEPKKRSAIESLGRAAKLLSPVSTTAEQGKFAGGGTANTTQIVAGNTRAAAQRLDDYTGGDDAIEKSILEARTAIYKAENPTLEHVMPEWLSARMPRPEEGSPDEQADVGGYDAEGHITDKTKLKILNKIQNRLNIPLSAPTPTATQPSATPGPQSSALDLTGHLQLIADLLQKSMDHNARLQATAMAQDRQLASAQAQREADQLSLSRTTRHASLSTDWAGQA